MVVPIGAALPTLRNQGVVFFALEAALLTVPALAPAVAVPLARGLWARRGQMGRALALGCIVTAALGVPLIGAVALTEYDARRVWAACRALEPIPFARAPGHLKAKAWVVRVRCQGEEGRTSLVCEWRSLLGARWGCTLTEEDGLARPYTGSG